MWGSVKLPYSYRISSNNSRGRFDYFFRTKRGRCDYSREGHYSTKAIISNIGTCQPFLHPLCLLGTEFYEGHWASFCVYPEPNPLIFLLAFRCGVLWPGAGGGGGGFTNRGYITLSQGWLCQKWKQPDMSDIRPQAPTSTGSRCTAVVTCSLQGLGHLLESYPSTFTKT